MPVKIFFCYAHEDESFLNKLKTHLRQWQRQGFIDIWHDRDIRVGTEWEQEIGKHLNSADIILLLVSPDFMGSDYCYGKEMEQALKRHEQKEARVIPIILRPFSLQEAPFLKLQMLPTDARPITKWSNIDEAFVNIADNIFRHHADSCVKMRKRQASRIVGRQHPVQIVTCSPGFHDASP